MGVAALRDVVLVLLAVLVMLHVVGAPPQAIVAEAVVETVVGAGAYSLKN
jgi:hypothetical protein